MTNTAETLAKIANAAEAQILVNATAEFRNWYLSLPREKRVEMAQAAFVKAAKQLA